MGSLFECEQFAERQIQWVNPNLSNELTIFRDLNRIRLRCQGQDVANGTGKQGSNSFLFYLQELSDNCVY